MAPTCCYSHRSHNLPQGEINYKTNSLTPLSGHGMQQATQVTQQARRGPADQVVVTISDPAYPLQYITHIRNQNENPGENPSPERLLTISNKIALLSCRRLPSINTLIHSTHTNKYSSSKGVKKHARTHTYTNMTKL